MDVGTLLITIFFIALGLFDLFIAHQALFRRRLYWVYPTITGFKRRKREFSSKAESYFFGIGTLFGAVLIFLFVAYCLFRNTQ